MVVPQQTACVATQRLHASLSLSFPLPIGPEGRSRLPQGSNLLLHSFSIGNLVRISLDQRGLKGGDLTSAARGSRTRLKAPLTANAPIGYSPNG